MPRKEEYEERTEDGRRPFESWELSQIDIARLLGVTRGAVDKWDLKKTRKSGRTILCNVKEAVDVRMANLKGDKENDGLAAARTRLANKQAEKLELEISVLRGRLIPIEVVISVWSDIAERFKSKLQAIPSKLSLRLAASKDAIECEELLKIANNEPLEEFQNVPDDVYVKEIAKYATTDSTDTEQSEKVPSRSKKKSTTAVKSKRK